MTSAFRHRVAIPNTADIDRVHAVEFLAAGVGGFCDRTLYAGVIESCARDWNDPGFLGEQPSQRDLSRCRLPLVRDLLKQIHQRLIRLPVLRVKPRDTVAEIGVIERRILVDFACEETLSQRAKWNEADSKFFKSRAGKTSFSGSGYQSEYSLWTAVTG